MGINRVEDDDVILEVEMLRVEVEMERRMRREAEAVGEAMAAELEEERRRRVEAEAEAAEMRAEVGRAMEELDDERRMLRVAEIWREERVRIKLADAMAAMELHLQQQIQLLASSADDGNRSSKATASGQQQQVMLRREIAAAGGGGENPHIVRGIKGFVEFPRAVRLRRREERDQKVDDLVSNLECQRAQLRAFTRRRHGDPPC
uniref:GTD-binding domain-containing protein n=1 Tax=Leersia perrieri TaxID=77586 RepID=A0A0D9XMH8_9ORYZ